MADLQDAVTRRNGETELRDRRSEVRGQKTDNLTLAPCALCLSGFWLLNPDSWILRFQILDILDTLDIS